ncbi:MAG: hypothetical protein ABFD20_09635 [Anaerolineales bacterium]
MTTQPEKPALSVPKWLYWLLHTWVRLSYRFQLEGAEHLPSDGPLLLLPTDVQGFLGPLAQMFGLVPVMVARSGSGARSVSIMHEQLYAIGAKGLSSAKDSIYGVRPHSAGTQALSLIDAYHALKEGGLVNINPEGDESWDGAGVGIRDGGAWLALRTAAPCVLVVPSAGLYDIWPFWERLPSLRGRLTLRYSPPFTVVDQPADRLTDTDLAHAREVIGSKLRELRFGAGGQAAWAPPPRQHGHEVPLPELRREVPVKRRFRRRPAGKQGIGLLLFQCPICGTTDSIVHRRGIGRRNTVRCRACGARWWVRREYGHDWRLILKRGPEDLVGLDVALSELHAYVKAHLTLDAAPDVSPVTIDPGEKVLLVANECRLTPYDRASVDAGLDGVAPVTRTEDHIGAVSTKPLGAGKLIMSDRRILWQRDGHAIEFDWDKVTALHLLFRNQLVLAHGAALYGVGLGKESAIKWIAYADQLLNGSRDRPERRVPVSPY